MTRRLVAVVILVLTHSALGAQDESRPTSRPETRIEDRVAQARREWAYRHQSADGRWSSDAFDAQCDPAFAERCAGKGEPGLDVGVTGLTLFMFQSCGYDSQRPGPYRDAIRKGLEWLVSRQDPEGRYGSTSDPGFHWSHVCATLAMTENWASTKEARWRDSALAAIGCLARREAATWPWNDPATPTGEGVRTAAWALLALSWAQNCELFRSQATVRDAIAFLDRVADAQEAAPATTASRSTSRREVVSARLSAFAGVAALVGRREMELAPDPGRDERAKRRVLASPLEWKERREPVDPEEIYFTTIAAFRESAWSRWSEDVRAILIDSQASKGCAVSSWDPAGERAKRGGRVGSTATMTLALALTWRYPKIFR